MYIFGIRNSIFLSLFALDVFRFQDHEKEYDFISSHLRSNFIYLSDFLFYFQRFFHFFIDRDFLSRNSRIF